MKHLIAGSIWNTLLAISLVSFLVLWPVLLGIGKVESGDTWAHANDAVLTRWNEIRTTWRWPLHGQGLPRSPSVHAWR